MRKTIATKILSISMSLALLIPSFVGSASAVGAPGVVLPDFARTMAPSEELGYVASAYDAGGAKRPRLIVIADLHAHMGVQRNIMGIMDNLVPTLRGASEKKVPVFVEGGWLPNLEEPLKGFSNPNVRRFMNEYYLHKAELGGPQAYSEKIAGTNQITMIGVEDKDEYLANKAIFAKSYPARKQVLEAIKFQEAAISLLQDSVEAHAYKKLQSSRDRYNDGRLSAERFAKILVHYADRFQIQDRYVAVLKDLPAANPSEVEIAFANIYRDVSTQLSESRPWTSYLRAKLPNEDAVRTNLSKVTADMDLLKRLVANQLTPSEVTLVMSRLPELEQTAALLLKDQPVTVDTKDVIRQSLEFYPLAILRNETLVKNSLKSLESFGADATGILVAGGFHTDAIAQYLKDRKISYLMINPNVSREITTSEELNYVKRMGNDHVTVSELKSDLDAIQSGRLSKGTGSSTSFVGVDRGQIQPGSPIASDQFFNGAPAVKDLVLKAMKTGDAADLAAAAKAMDDLGLDINAADTADLTLELVDGQYRVQGQEGPSVVADILNQRLAKSLSSARPQTIHIQARPDKAMILETGGEATYSSADGQTGIIKIAISRFQAVTALQTIKPEANSKEEANAIRGAIALTHEATHAYSRKEGPTIAVGLVHAAKAVDALVAQGHLADNAVDRIADAVLPQLKAGEATRANAESLRQKIANALTPKALKAESVQALASELSQDIPGTTPDQVAQLLQAESPILVQEAAMFGGFGKSKLRARIQEIFKNMRQTATNA